MIITLQKRSILTISRELREELGINPGDPLEVEVKNGRLVITPVSVVPRPSRLSESGKKKETAASSDVKRGRVRKFHDTKSLLDELNENS